MENPILLFLLGQIITGAAIWGAIRADIRNMHQRIIEVKQSVSEAHQRVDRMLEHRMLEHRAKP